MPKKLMADMALEDPNGFVRIDVCLSNVGVMPYQVLDADGNAVVRNALMPFETLDALTKVKQNLVVTNDHPNGGVDPENSKNLVVGFVDSFLEMRGNELWGQLVLTDRDAIDDVKTGKRDVSMGYNETKIQTVTEFEGIPVDYTKTNLVLNHLALVDAGRAKKAALKLDTQTYIVNTKSKPLEMTLKTIITNVGAIEVADSSVNVLTDLISKMDAVSQEFELFKQNSKKDSETLEGVAAASAVNIDALKAENQALKDELDSLRLTTVDAEGLSKELTNRLEAWDSVGGINNKDVAFDASLTVSQIQRAKIKALVGDSMDLDIDSQSDDFVKGMFLSLNTKVNQQTPVETTKTTKLMLDSAGSTTKSSVFVRDGGNVGFSIFKNN